MLIWVQDELLVVNFLCNENVFVMMIICVMIQEICFLKVLIFNLMLKKIEMENQFLCLLLNFLLQVDIQLLCIDVCELCNIFVEYLNNFYCNFDEICDQNFDGLIVIGVFLGLVEFNDVVYWLQIKQVLEWVKDYVILMLFVCWVVQVVLNILYGIFKQICVEKIFGVYEYYIFYLYVLLICGFDDFFLVLYLCYVDFLVGFICDYIDFEIFVEMEEGDVYLFVSKDKCIVFVIGYLEYDVNILVSEYFCDVEVGLNFEIFYNYFL